MGWRIEDWWCDIRPGIGEYGETYKDLDFRELVIVACADLDHALAALIARRLRGPTKEIEEFLGADGDGRAPCGSFGARIQMALLLDIITSQDAKLLRSLKAIRNLVAHRVTRTYDHPEVQAALLSLLRCFVRWMESFCKGPAKEPENAEKHYLNRLADKSVGEGLVLKIIGLFHIRFTATYENASQIDAVPEILRIGRTEEARAADSVRGPSAWTERRHRSEK